MHSRSRAVAGKDAGPKGVALPYLAGLTPSDASGPGVYYGISPQVSVGG
jgi:hypothetical protein